MKRIFQLESYGRWYQISTDLQRWYVVAEQENRVYDSLLDLPMEWQTVLVNLAYTAETPEELAADAAELRTVLDLLDGTKVHIADKGAPRVDGVAVY